MPISPSTSHSSSARRGRPLPTPHPEGLHGGHAYADKVVSYLDGRDDGEQSKPFFAYLPFTAPRWPLHASKEVCDKYRGVCDDGPDALRLKRLQRLKELGMVDKNIKPRPVAVSDDKAGRSGENSPKRSAAPPAAQWTSMPEWSIAWTGT